MCQDLQSTQGRPCRMASWPWYYWSRLKSGDLKDKISAAVSETYWPQQRAKKHELPRTQESRKNPESAAMTLRWHLFNVPANPLSCRADGQTMLSEQWLLSKSDCFSIVLTKINPERDTRCRAYSLRATIAAGSWQSESARCLSMYNESSIGWDVSIWGSEVEFHGVPSWCQELTWIGSSCGVSDSSFSWTRCPRCESRKNWKWILLFDVSSAVSSLNPWPSIGSTMDVHRTVTSQGSNLCWSGPEFTRCIRFTEAWKMLGFCKGKLAVLVKFKLGFQA